jgi:hypothetical protein
LVVVVLVALALCGRTFCSTYGEVLVVVVLNMAAEEAVEMAVELAMEAVVDLAMEAVDLAMEVEAVVVMVAVVMVVVVKEVVVVVVVVVGTQVKMQEQECSHHFVVGTQHGDQGC